MKNLIAALLLLFVACSSTQPVTQPVQNPPVTTPPIPHGPAADPDTVYRDSIVYRTVVKDSVVYQQVLYPVPLNLDTTTNIVTLHPLGGNQDDQPQIQAAVNAHLHIHLIGHFLIYSPIIVATLNGSDYGQSWCDIEGQSFAQNTVAGFTTWITTAYGNWPALMIQQGKGCVIKNIAFYGQYAAPLTQYQVNTYTRTQWRDTGTSDAPTHPCAGIAIDPFTTPASLGGDTTKMYPGMVGWYLPGMSKSGSTDIQIRGCSFANFNVSIVFTLGYTQDDECNTVDHCFFGNCMSAIASTQAQAKTNWVTRCIGWGMIHTVIDAAYYGLNHGDGATSVWVDGFNIAGFPYQFCQTNNLSFPQYYEHVYAENIVKVGFTGSQWPGNDAGVSFDHCQFDFEPGAPSPGWWYHGGSTSWIQCMLRYYDGTPHRIVLNDWGNLIQGGNFGAAPVVVFGQGNTPYTDIQSLKLFYTPNPFTSIVKRANYDSIVQSPDALLRVNSLTYGGYYLTTDTAGLTPGTLILTPAPDTPDTLAYYQYPPPGPTNSQTALGWVSSLSADTVRLQNVWVGAKDSTVYSVFKALYKAH